MGRPRRAASRAAAVLGGACTAALAVLVPASAPAPPVAAAAPLRMTVGTVGPIGSLDPRHGDSVVAREVWNIQYPTLTSLDARTLDPTAGVANAWRPAPGGRGWIYSLQPGQTWSDGRPVTAADVVYSLDHARDDHWPYATGMLDGLSARALDTHSIEITSARADSGLPSLLLHVVPEHVYAATADLGRDPARLGVGDGAWHVVASAADSVELDVVGRPGGPPLDQIVFRTYATTEALLAALAHGDVDVVSGVPISDAGRLEAMRGVTVDHAPDGSQFVLSIGDTGALADARTRRAISLAIDRTELVTQAVDGIGTPTVVPELARGSRWALAPAAASALGDSLDAQPGAARRLLTRALAGRVLPLVVGSDPLSRRVGDFVRKALHAAGVETAVVDEPPSSIETAGLVIDRITIGDDPATMLSTLRCSRCAALHARFVSTADLTARLTAAHEMLQEATAQATVVGLFEPDVLQAFRSDRLAGFLPRPEQPSLVVFGPTVDYGGIVAAQIPPGEQLGSGSYVVGALIFLVVCIAGYFVVARLRGRGVT